MVSVNLNKKHFSRITLKINPLFKNKSSISVENMNTLYETLMVYKYEVWTNKGNSKQKWTRIDSRQMSEDNKTL